MKDSTSIADMFKAQLDDLKARSDASDRHLAEHLAKIRGHLAELTQLDQELTKIEAI